ncbi:unnamed protein product [Rangifer tarandus platyrhynchus]|uniref:Uncharacterized protein n=1 Tax=Rangifer tarandus platyrhynchus TaxID=3082113 RepID=A0AC59Y498_RANTA
MGSQVPQLSPAAAAGPQPCPRPQASIQSGSTSPPPQAPAPRSRDSRQAPWPQHVRRAAKPRFITSESEGARPNQSRTGLTKARVQWREIDAGRRGGGAGGAQRDICLPDRTLPRALARGPRPLSSRGHALGGGHSSNFELRTRDSVPAKVSGGGDDGILYPPTASLPPRVDPGLLPLSLEAQGLLAVWQRLPQRPRPGSVGLRLAQWAARLRGGVAPGSGGRAGQAPNLYWGELLAVGARVDLGVGREAAQS